MQNSSDKVEIHALSSGDDKKNEAETKSLQGYEAKEKPRNASAIDLLKSNDQNEINTYSLDGIMEYGKEFVAAAVDAKESKSLKFLIEMKSIMDRAARIRLFDLHLNECIKEWDGLLKITPCSSMFLNTTYAEQYQRWLKATKISNIQITEEKISTVVKVLKNEDAAKIIRLQVEAYKKAASGDDKIQRLFAGMGYSDIEDKVIWHAHQDCSHVMSCVQAVHDALKRHNSWENREAMAVALEDFDRAQTSRWLPKLDSWRSVLSRFDQLAKELRDRVKQNRPARRDKPNLLMNHTDPAEQKYLLSSAQSTENKGEEKIIAKQKSFPSILLELSHDLVDIIFTHLGPEDKIRLCLTAKFLVSLCSYNELWAPHLKPQFSSIEFSHNGQAKQLYIQNEYARLPLIVLNALTSAQVATAVLGMKYLRHIEFDSKISNENATMVAAYLPIDARIFIYPDLPLEVAQILARELRPLGRLVVSSVSSQTYLAQLAAVLSVHAVLEVPADMPVNAIVAIASALSPNGMLSLDPVASQDIIEQVLPALLTSGGILNLHSAMLPQLMVNIMRIYSTKIMLPAQLQLEQVDNLMRSTKAQAIYLHPYMSRKTVSAVVNCVGTSYNKLYVYTEMHERTLAQACRMANTVLLNKTSLVKAVLAAAVCSGNFELDTNISDDDIAVIIMALRQGCKIKLFNKTTLEKAVYIASCMHKGLAFYLPRDISKESAVSIAQALSTDSELILPEFSTMLMRATVEAMPHGCILNVSELSDTTATLAASMLLPAGLVQIQPKMGHESVHVSSILSIPMTSRNSLYLDWSIAKAIVKNLKPQCGIVLPQEIMACDAITIAELLPAHCFIKLFSNVSAKIAVAITQGLNNTHKIILDEDIAIDTAEEIASAVNPGCILEFSYGASFEMTMFAVMELQSGSVVTLPTNLSDKQALEVVSCFNQGVALLLSSQTTLSQAITLVEALPTWCGLVITPTMSASTGVELVKVLPPGCTIILSDDLSKNTALEIVRHLPLAADLKLSERMSTEAKVVVQNAYEQRFVIRSLASTNPSNSSIARSPFIMLREQGSTGIGFMRERTEQSGLEHLISGVFQYKK